MFDHTHACGRYEKKRILVKAGHRGEFLYYIYNGSVSVTIEHIVDDVTSINLKPGTIFGVSYMYISLILDRCSQHQGASLRMHALVQSILYNQYLIFMSIYVSK